MANVQQWNDNNTNASKWTLSLVSGECNDDVCANLGGDTDGDGICDADDQCPGFNDNLIGTACDDGDPSTINETWQSDCSCGGGVLASCNDCIQNGDETGIDCGGSCPTCNNSGPCQITINNNGPTPVELYYYTSMTSTPQNYGTIAANASVSYNAAAGSKWVISVSGQVLALWNTDCENPIYNYLEDNDFPSECLPFLNENTNPQIDQSVGTNQYIQTNGIVQSGDIEYRAEEYILMMEGFEVKQGAVYHALIAPCNQ